MVGESLVIKQGQPESHEINNEVIVNSLTANLLTVFFYAAKGDANEEICFFYIVSCIVSLHN